MIVFLDTRGTLFLFPRTKPHGGLTSVGRRLLTYDSAYSAFSAYRYHQYISEVPRSIGVRNSGYKIVPALWGVLMACSGCKTNFLVILRRHLGVRVHIFFPLLLFIAARSKFLPPPPPRWMSVAIRCDRVLSTENKTAAVSCVHHVRCSARSRPKQIRSCFYSSEAGLSVTYESIPLFHFDSSDYINL